MSHENGFSEKASKISYLSMKNSCIFTFVSLARILIRRSTEQIAYE